MKRHLFRDIGRGLRAGGGWRYALAVLRRPGGVHPRECTLCGYRVLFRAFGHPPRYDAQWPQCGSRERHRLLGLMLKAHLDLDASVDLFVLNHVLEHVDDAKALAELHRCLVPGGRAIVTAPVVEGWITSYEGPAIAHGAGEALRTLHVGQADHLRWFGAEMRRRIEAAGFSRSEFTAGGADAVRYGLTRGETVFIASKEAGA